MDISQPCPLAVELSARIRAAQVDLTSRWLERIRARIQLQPDQIFPSAELLGHVPVLINGIADYIEDPCEEITADLPVISKAMELGDLRFAQGFDGSEILKEYEILGGILFSFSAEVAAETTRPCTREELLVCGHRLFRAISVIEQATTTQYLRALGERVAEREERLRRFNRMIGHELKNRVGSTLGAAQLLQEDWLGPAERRRFATIAADNAMVVQKVLENLVALSQIESRRRPRDIKLREVVVEVFRQLRELARGRNVRLRMAEDLPDVEVNAAAVELCLSNYLSNAIKYAEPGRSERWARVDARLDRVDHEPELVVLVHDNGIGVPQDRRSDLFERFYRAHEDVNAVEGTGLGLNLVKETVESLGGRVWAEFDDAGIGATFAFALPLSVQAMPLTGRDEAADAEDLPQDAAPATAYD